MSTTDQDVPTSTPPGDVADPNDAGDTVKPDDVVQDIPGSQLEQSKQTQEDEEAIMKSIEIDMAAADNLVGLQGIPDPLTSD